MPKRVVAIRAAARFGWIRTNTRAQEILDEHVTVQICQEKRVAHFQGNAQALDCRARLCLAGKEQETVEELRALAQHQLAVRQTGVLAQETFSTNGTPQRSTMMRSLLPSFP